MTLIEFIKSKLSKDNEFGDLSKDIQGDKEFPFDKTEEEIISYLDFKTNRGGTNASFKKLIQAYKKHKDTGKSEIDVDAKFAVLRTENWKFYKEHFPVDKIILVGRHSDFYKVYCVDSTNQKALYFDIKSSNSLNDLSIIDEGKIHIGNLTEQVSVSEAIILLENCTYDTPVKPNEENFKELMDFLKLNN